MSGRPERFIGDLMPWFVNTTGVAKALVVTFQSAICVRSYLVCRLSPHTEEVTAPPVIACIRRVTGHVSDDEVPAVTTRHDEIEHIKSLLVNKKVCNLFRDYSFFPTLHGRSRGCTPYGDPSLVFCCPLHLRSLGFAVSTTSGVGRSQYRFLFLNPTLHGWGRGRYPGLFANKYRRSIRAMLLFQSMLRFLFVKR